MICENCNVLHSGSYGSGRFCSSKCARSFSTKSKRKEINIKVSEKLKGRPASNPFKKGYDRRRAIWTIEQKNKLSNTQKLIYLKKLEKTNFENLPLGSIYNKLLLEQNNKCLHCGLSEWLDKPIKLELDHIDGNNRNNIRENVRLLCPNCHSLTENFRGRNINKNRTYISDEEFLLNLKSSSSIRQALIKMNLTPKAGNYARAYRLMGKLKNNILIDK